MADRGGCRGRSSAFLDGLVALYDRALVVALRHRQITLTVMVFTVCADRSRSSCGFPKDSFRNRTPA